MHDFFFLECDVFLFNKNLKKLGLGDYFHEKISLFHHFSGRNVWRNELKCQLGIIIQGEISGFHAWPCHLMSTFPEEFSGKLLNR